MTNTEYIDIEESFELPFPDPRLSEIIEDIEATMDGPATVRINYQPSKGGFTARLEIHTNPARIAALLTCTDENPVTPQVYTITNKFGLISGANDGAEPHIFDSLGECFAVGEKVKSTWLETIDPNFYEYLEDAGPIAPVQTTDRDFVSKLWVEPRDLPTIRFHARLDKSTRVYCQSGRVAICCSLETGGFRAYIESDLTVDVYCAKPEDHDILFRSLPMTSPVIDNRGHVGYPLPETTMGEGAYTFDTFVECLTAAGEALRHLELLDYSDDMYIDQQDNAQDLGETEASAKDSLKLPSGKWSRFIAFGNMALITFTDAMMLLFFIFAVAGLGTVPPFDYRMSANSSMFLAINCLVVVVFPIYCVLRAKDPRQYRAGIFTRLAAS